MCMCESILVSGTEAGLFSLSRQLLLIFHFIIRPRARCLMFSINLEYIMEIKWKVFYFPLYFHLLNGCHLLHRRRLALGPPSLASKLCLWLGNFVVIYSRFNHLLFCKSLFGVTTGYYSTACLYQLGGCWRYLLTTGLSHLNIIHFEISIEWGMKFQGTELIIMVF